MEISVLCKVVDNYGDIGVTWRMVKQLKKNLDKSDYEWAENVKINLIIDDLISFNKINHFVRTDVDFQTVEEIDIYYSKNEDFCYKAFAGNWDKLQIILECFQCGRPDWMEKILFEDGLEKTVNIIMIDYLTAEDYAEDFHQLQSLTRSSKVQKINFMPGFTSKTGGLIIDDEWENPFKRNENGPIMFFTYERNWQCVFNGIEKAYSEEKINNTILLAQGRGRDSAIESYNQIKNKNHILMEEMSFVDQNEWDAIMKQSSVLFIRGEESMSRACLSGIPFVWHAYPQSDEYQLVKVKALLHQMENYFEKDLFKIIERLWILINSPQSDNYDEDIEELVYLFMKNRNKFGKSFLDFSNNLRKNGDLTVNLMTFINKKYII